MSRSFHNFEQPPLWMQVLGLFYLNRILEHRVTKRDANFVTQGLNITKEDFENSRDRQLKECSSLVL